MPDFMTRPTVNGSDLALVSEAAPMIAQGRPKAAGAAIACDVPGVTFTASATLTLAAATVRYFPALVRTPITLDQLLCEVTTAGTAATTLRLGIYNADTDWQPTTLVLDAGTVAATTTGVKTITVSQTLTAGRYLFALNTDSAATIRTYRGGGAMPNIALALGTTALISQLRATLTYAAFGSTGTAWTTTSTVSSGFDYGVFVRLSSP